MTDMLVEAVMAMLGGADFADVSATICKILKTLAGMMDNTASGKFTLNYMLSFFGGLCGALLVLNWLIDLASMASRDLLSFEKLVLSFIKCIAAFCLVINSPLLLKYLFQFGNNVWEIVNAKVTVDAGTAYDKEAIKTQVYGWLGVSPDEDSILKQVGAMFKSGQFTIFALIVNLGFLGIKIITYFLCLTTGVKVILRAILSPFAIVQVFDEGQRSAGIRWLKKFLAAILTFAGITLCLYAYGAIVSSYIADVIAGTGIIDGDKLNEAKGIENCLEELFSFKTIGITLAGAAASIGAMLGINKMIEEAIGA